MSDTFTYNGDGQRVQKLDSTGTTKHIWDGENILLETDGSNVIQVVYTLKPDDIRQVDLAEAERDDVILPLRWIRLDSSTHQRHGWRNR